MLALPPATPPATRIFHVAPPLSCVSFPLSLFLSFSLALPVFMWLGQIWSPLENWILYFMRVQSKFYVQFAARAEIKIPNECFAKWNIKRPTGRNASAAVAAAALNELRMGRTCELATMRQLWHMEALRNRLLLASAPLWTWSELLLFLSLSVCLCLSLSLFSLLYLSPFPPTRLPAEQIKPKKGNFA